jgi:hypothetical protein
MSLLVVAGVSTSPGWCSDPKLTASYAPRLAVEKSLNFLQTDSIQWRKKATCATCHHGAITAWAFSEAQKSGYRIPAGAFEDMLGWTKARFVPAIEEKPNLTNGFDIPSLALPILAATLWTRSDALTPDDLHRMTKYILDRQQSDGGWPLQQRNPHPVFESREVLTAWFYLALEPSARATDALAETARTGRKRARSFLDASPVADTTQSQALRLLLDVRDAKRPGQLRKQVHSLLRRQNPDGGWSQTPALASDAYATGQALYVLSLAGAKPDRKEVRNGVAFLLSTELEDGSWAMVPRVTPDRPVASKNLEPIVHFATAWAAMGLVRSLPAAKPITSIRVEARNARQTNYD